MSEILLFVLFDDMNVVLVSILIVNDCYSYTVKYFN